MYCNENLPILLHRCNIYIHNIHKIIYVRELVDLFGGYDIIINSLAAGNAFVNFLFFFIVVLGEKKSQPSFRHTTKYKI